MTILTRQWSCRGKSIVMRMSRIVSHQNHQASVCKKRDKFESTKYSDKILQCLPIFCVCTTIVGSVTDSGYFLEWNTETIEKERQGTKWEDLRTLDQAKCTAHFPCSLLLRLLWFLDFLKLFRLLVLLDLSPHLYASANLSGSHFV